MREWGVNKQPRDKAGSDALKYTGFDIDCLMAVFIHLKCYRRDIVHSKENVTGGTMSADVEMTLEERRKYLRLMQKRYIRASRAEQGEMLDEMLSVTGLHVRA